MELRQISTHLQGQLLAKIVPLGQPAPMLTTVLYHVTLDGSLLLAQECVLFVLQASSAQTKQPRWHALGQGKSSTQRQAVQHVPSAQQGSVVLQLL